MRKPRDIIGQPHTPIGTLLSGYSSFNTNPPPNLPHPAVAKITIAPGHNPGKIGAPKPPKLPDKPTQPYMRYSKKIWDTMKQNHPELKTFEIAREIGKNWRDMPASERRVYQQEYEHEKREYYERINMYNRSGPYQQYLAAKQRWESAEIKDDDDMYFSMEPVDDVQTDDNAFSHRALCAARFHRNKFFMMDILSESVIINQMKIMRQEQLDSLSVHRKGLVENIDKFKKSIEECKENHFEKKRRWTKQADDLDAEWKRLSKMSPEEYLAEYKSKQEQARIKRVEEEEEKKRREAEEAKKKAEEEQKDEEKPLLENMESKQSTEKTPNDEQDTENPIQAMHQMVSMAGENSNVDPPPTTITSKAGDGASDATDTEQLQLSSTQAPVSEKNDSAVAGDIKTETKNPDDSASIDQEVTNLASQVDCKDEPMETSNDTPKTE